mgnify:CR=1 FL=1
MMVQGKPLSTVDLNWNEAYYTNRPLVSAEAKLPETTELLASTQRIG